MLLGKLFVADITALKERRVRAQAEDMVIGVRLPSVQGGTPK